MTKKIKLSRLVLIPVLLGLIFSLFYTGVLMLTNDAETNVSKFLLTKMGAGLEQNVNTLSRSVIPVAGLVGIVSSLVLVLGLVKKEFLFSDRSRFIQWGLFLATLSVSIYGFGVRIISNHMLAGTLFFYTAILFILLKIVERKTPETDSALKNLQWLPITFLIFYTMGFTGYQKLFNTEMVMPKYVEMFSNTILAQMPGGIPPFIYLLGICEFVAGILAVIALVKGEFIAGKSKTFMRWMLFLTVFTFFQLSIGLFILVNIPGAVNLLLYAIFSTVLFYLIEENEDKSILI